MKYLVRSHLAWRKCNLVVVVYVIECMHGRRNGTDITARKKEYFLFYHAFIYACSYVFVAQTSAQISFTCAQACV